MQIAAREIKQQFRKFICGEEAVYSNFYYINRMITENSRRIKRIKKLFYIGAGVWAVASLVFFLIREDLFGFIAAGILIVWFLAFQYTDFQYIWFEVDNGKITLRYYPVVKFGRKDYSSAEFPLNTLYDYRLEKSVFGLVEDLVLVVRTRRGLGEYPSVSLAALSKMEKQQIEKQLRMLLKR